MKIMLVDDEPSIQNLVKQLMLDEGYEFCSAIDGRTVFEVVQNEQPDLIILDVMMPGMDGFRVCSALREQGHVIPIIFLSAKGDLVDKSIGFTVGGDDYMVKPFSTEELVMRVQAHLRSYKRFEKNMKPVIQVKNLEIEVAKHRVLLDGREVLMTPKEFAIIKFLAEQCGEIVTREQLIEEVWGPEFICETSSVAVFIRKIREKVEKDPAHPSLIKTVRNAGYIFSED